jgi:hypothetical protein
VSWGPRPPRPCEEDVIDGVSQSDKFFFFEDGFYDECENPETCCGGVTEPAVLGIVGPTVARFYASIVSRNTLSARVFYGSNLRAIADISVNMRCEDAVINPDSPGIYIDFDFFVVVPGLDGLVPIYPTRGLGKQATLKLQTACESRASATCSDSDQQKTYRFATPITFTVSNESAGLTSWDPVLTFDNSVGDQSRVTPCFDQLIDNFAATFRITSRPSCKTTDCSCGQSLANISLSLYSETFLVENEPNPDRGGGDAVWSYTDSANNPVIEYTLWNPGFLEEKYKVRAEIFCSSEQQADGNVGPVGRDAWYAVVYIDCFSWENGSVSAQTRDTYVGAYECYEHCGRFMPFGSPSLMYLVSRVTTPGLASCDPLPAVAIVVGHEGCPE